MTISDATLSERLWQTVLESVGALRIDASCQLFLKAWITNGVERMEDERRLTPKDIATANENLKSFMDAHSWGSASLHPRLKSSRAFGA